MTKSTPKLTLSQVENIPFNKLLLAQSNVRRVKAGLSIEDLAEDIAHRTLLQSINVRPVLDAADKPTGMYEIPAGGRRYRALQLLVKQKRLAKTALVPCIVRSGGIAEEDSLAENVQRVALHPLDQFRAFQSLRDKGLAETDIAARFFVTPAIVKQRLRLANVAPGLLEVYASDGMTLDQLMAFTVSENHERQIEVWDAVSKSTNDEPYNIRRCLTEHTVPGTDARARLVGIAAYEAAGGVINRDLFSTSTNCWFQDVALLEKLTTDRLQAAAVEIAAEGWKWIETATSFAYARKNALRQLDGDEIAMTAAETHRLAELNEALDRLDEDYAETEDIPETIDAQQAALIAEVAAIETRPVTYDATGIPRAGVFISLNQDGTLNIDRGYVRPEDEEPGLRDAGGTVADDGASAGRATSGGPGGASGTCTATGTKIINGSPAEPVAVEDDDDGAIKPLSERLLSELSTYRTLALRDAIANNPDVAATAVLHALCLATFYRGSFSTCLNISAESRTFLAEAPDLAQSQPARAIAARTTHWKQLLPDDPQDLWHVLGTFDAGQRAALLAHCVSQTADALHDPWRGTPGRLTHADTLARDLGLDIAATGWTATAANYLERVPKPRILEAVQEAKGDSFVQLIAHMKKSDMAREAQRMLEGTGWLPEPLRTQDLDGSTNPENAPGVQQEVTLPDFLSGNSADEAADPEDVYAP